MGSPLKYLLFTNFCCYSRRVLAICDITVENRFVSVLQLKRKQTQNFTDTRRRIGMSNKATRRMTAMAMSIIMAAAAFQSSPMNLIANASTSNQEAKSGITFPDTYTQDLVQPVDDEVLINTKVEALIKSMTTEEKYSFLGGSGTGSEGNAGDLPGVPRLGVPRIKMYDGPAGLLYTEETTNVPQEQMLAATWDEEMANLYGEVYSSESKAMGGTFMLSAQLDIQRHPFWNRTKDQMGEDSYLLSSLSDDLVQGMQSEGGIAVLKHFAVASDEGALMSDVNQTVDEQTLHELYLPGFESAIQEGGALGVMSGYNKTNGEYSSENRYLLQDVLRNMWNYNYFTVTDWGGNHSFTIDDGTDIEMPSMRSNSQENAQQLVEDGTYTQEEMDEMIDQSVRRILKAYGKAGYLTLVEVDENGYAKEEEGRTEVIDIASDKEALKELAEENNEKVQTVAEEGGVLLKNEDDALPLNTDGDNTVAVIGVNGMSLIPGVGGERSYGSISAMTSPYEALCDLLGEEKVEGEVYEDMIGTIIPAEYLYTTLNGEEHGAIRTYGTGQSADSGEVYQGQFVSNSVPEQQMGDHEIGEIWGTDEVIDFNTGTIDGEANKTYVNGEDGNAFPYSERPAYSWTTYVEAPEDGTYTIIFQSIGGQSAMGMYSIAEDGTETQIGSASGASVSQGTQWYGSIIPSETGENLSSITVTLEKGKRYKIGIASANTLDGKDMQVGLAWVTPSQKQQNIDAALQAAEQNDTVVVFAYSQANNVGSTLESTTLKLSDDQQTMILDVAEAAHSNGNKVVVVLNNSAAVVMEDWIDEADAILEMYYPGQRGGVATANLLTGEVNPSGKLAFTIPKKDSDTLVTYSQEAFDNFKVQIEDAQTNNVLATNADEEEEDEEAGGFPDFGGGFPGFGGGGSYEMTYSEGIYTGYRWYDKMNVEPEYDFGYGLSYTTFSYSNMAVTESREEGESAGYDVSFTVTNTGDVTGSEVAQVYLGEAQVPDGIQSAVYQLAGYEKVKDLEPGESRNVTIHVTERALSYWNSNQEELNVNDDGTKDKWTVAEGVRTIYVGSSSDNLLMQEEVTVTAKDVETGDNETVGTGLDRMISMVESLEASDYTSDSWSILEDALREAKEVRADENATTEELDEAMSNLIKAFGGLEYGIQKLHLETALKAAEAILSSAADYEDECEALKKAIEEAEVVLADGGATQKEVNEAAYAVLDELARLAKRADLSSLESLITASETLLNGKYTESSLENLQAAIENAKQVIEDENREDGAISEAYEELVNAIIQLQMKGNKAALEAMIEKAEEILESENAYVSSTLEGLQESLATAQEVNSDDNALQEDIDAAVEDLTQKVAGVRLKGDVNEDGTVSTSDSTALLQYASELNELDADARASADVNEDGVADTSDAVLILQYAAEKISSF